MEIVEVNDGYIMASWNPAHQNWVSPMTAAAAKQTGCHSMAARNPETLARDGNVQVYRHRSSAQRAMRGYDD